MFTGLIDHTATIQSIEKTSDDMTLVISHAFGELFLGESIAIDGVCLTVTQFDKNTFHCQLSPETLRLTTASYYQVGQRVNCERAMSAGDRFGGHMVTGHVDGVIAVADIEHQADFSVVRFAGVDAESMPLLVSKGSVTINGVSLTVNAVTADGFSVTLIPHTLSITNLKLLEKGQNVNIEYDYLAKLVQRNLSLYAQNIPKER